MEWARNNLVVENAVYVDNTLFKTYGNWYDMYLMACCKHNIIANSSFNWWGAWLNPNKDKIVIAPKKWLNDANILDILPDRWKKT